MNFLRKSIGKIWSFIKRHKIISAVAVVILVVLIFFIWPRPGQKIETYTVKPEHFVNSISVDGTVNADRSVNLTFLAGGKLVYLGVKKGDYVFTGQTIAVLDQQTALKNLQAALIDYSKQRNEFDQTQENYQNRTPNQALNEQMKRILQNNQYNLDKAVNSVELYDLAKQNLIVTTPISGIVTKADVKTAGVNVSATTTFTIVDPESLVFEMDVDEAEIANVKEEQTADIILNAFPDDSFKAKVSSIDFATHTTATGGNAYIVATALSKINKPFRIGMEGNAEIITDEKSGVIVVPISSIVDENYVYVKMGKKYKKIKVKAGEDNDLNVVIEKGLNIGDLVVIDPTLLPKESK